jgi:transcription elongation factor GreA
MTITTAVLSKHDEVPLTREGYERLHDELASLTTITRMEMSKRLRDAREQGGELTDNPELIDALEDQEMLERRIATLKASLAAARVVDNPPRDGTIGIGTRVRLRDDDSGRPAEYDVVGSAEADPVRGRLSAESPVGRALLGRRSGDIFEVETPLGRRRFRILSTRPDGRLAECLNVGSRHSRAAPRGVDRTVAPGTTARAAPP